MLRQAENNVTIIGTLSENNIKYGSYEKDGITYETIGGSINVLVKQEINGAEQQMEIPIQLFSQKYIKSGPKKGEINPAYESIEKVMQSYVSIAAAASTGATPDRVRITKAKITMNEYFNGANQLVSFPRISATFVNKATDNMKDCATFTSEFVVSSMARVTDSEGIEVEPTKLKIMGVVSQYGGKIDVVPFYAVTPNAISSIEQYWEPNSSVKVEGKLNFTSVTTTVVEENADDWFGEPTEKTRTSTVSELIITAGSRPLADNLAFDIEEINKGIAERKARLQKMKDKPAANHGAKKAPASTTSTSQMDDLGF